MTDVKAYPDKHLTFAFVPENGLADPNTPTATELNAAPNLSRAIAWDGTEINPSDSSDIDDAAITDSATAVEPGFDQYEGTLTGFFPKDMTNPNDPFVEMYETFAPGRVKGYLVRRLKIADVNTDTSMALFAVGDFVQVFRVIADFVTHDTEGEDSTKYTVNFLSQGFMSQPIMVKSAEAVAVTPATLSGAVGSKHALKATVGGFDVTRDVKWTSDDVSKAVVSSTGVVKFVAVGTANISASLAQAGADGTSVATITA